MTDVMSQPHDCGGDVAAYALGALEPAEADAFQHHLTECAVCRDELVRFRLAVDALPLAAPQYTMPRQLRKRVMADVHAEPRAASAPERRRPRFSWSLARPAAAFAACAVLALAVVGVIKLASTGPSTRVLSAAVGNAQLQVTGDRGELVVSRLPLPPAGRIYELWTERGKQPPSRSTLFSVRSNGTGLVAVPGSLTGVSAVLVTQEPAGGTNVPTERPLIVAPT